MQANPPSSLAFFRPVRAIGRGAMGEVWLAEHTQAQAQVAIKFLRVPPEQAEQAAQGLTNEVQACARLTHPNIVSVLDLGRVDLRGMAAMEHRFPLGTPFLVMEFIPGRSLQSAVGRVSWSRARAILELLLDALAHSHARGVIHRDLKPGNVLLRQPPLSDPSVSRPPDPLITDFGVAQAFTRGAQGTREVVGTPAYMAPEQLQARWRDQGPWTDLYSVGCLAWSLVTAQPPFGRGRSFEENREAHLRQEPPRLEPQVAVPDELEGWLRRLLVKDPGQRYVRAADALEALRALPAASAPAAPVVPPAPQISSPEDDTDPVTAPDPGLVPAPRSVAQRPPAQWARPAAAQPPQLFGVGLNLYGLREVPLVARGAERDALWEALRRVTTSGRPHAVLLEGPRGCGTSRLAEWVSERAHEVGAAIVLEAGTADETEGAASLGRALARYFRVEGMVGERRLRRLHRLLAAHGVHAEEERRTLAELVGAGDGDKTTPLALGTPGERHKLMVRLLRAISAGPEGPRPVVLVLDDAPYAPDAISLTRLLLQEGDDVQAPVLAVLTASTDSLPGGAALRGLFNDLRAEPGLQRLPLGPLPADAMTQLVKHLIGIEGRLVDGVVRHAAGNPHYAIELIRDWVQQGKLVLGKRGFELRAGASGEMPASLQQTWQIQVERQLSRLDPTEVRALELAAALGNQVDSSEWHAVCGLTGMNASERLLSQILESGMARPAANGLGWVFGNPMYRAVLETRSKKAGRYRRIHLACARMLEARPTEPGHAERSARHLLKAGKPNPALPKLLKAAQERLDRGQIVEAERIIDARDETLRRMRVPTEDPLWGRGWLQKVRLYRLTDREDEATVLAERALQSARRHRWSAIETQALAELAALDDARMTITPA